MIELFNHATPYFSDNPEVEWLHALLAAMFCKEALPFRLIQSESFKVHYVLPSHKALSGKLVPDLSAKVQSDVKQDLAQANMYAITTDMWTSIDNISYTGVTAHWLDNNNSFI